MFWPIEIFNAIAADEKNVTKIMKFFFEPVEVIVQQKMLDTNIFSFSHIIF